MAAPTSTPDTHTPGNDFRSLFVFARPFEALGVALSGLENRRGKLAVSVVAALGLVAIASIAVAPSFPFFPENIISGDPYYAKISEDPFGFDFGSTARGYRILVPLAAYLTGFRGDNFTYFNFLLLIGLLAYVHYRARIFSGDQLFALAIASTAAFSAVGLLTLYDLRLVDGARVLLMLLMMQFRRNPLIFWLLFAASLFAHEGALTFIPFFILLRWLGRRSVAEFAVTSVLGLGLCLAAYLPFYFTTGTYAQAAGQGAAESTYIGKILTDGFPIFRDYVGRWAWFAHDALFSALGLFWAVFIFGLVYMWRRRHFDLLLMLALIVGFIPTAMIGADITRYGMLLYPGVIIATAHLPALMDVRVAAQGILHLSALSLLVPNQVYWDNLGTMLNLPMVLLLWIF